MTAAAATTTSCAIALGNATAPPTCTRVALWTDVQPDSISSSSLDIYVTSSEFASVWNSPMHLSLFAALQTVQIHVVQGTSTPQIASALQTSLLLAGFVATGEQRSPDGVVLQAQKRAPDVRLQAKPLVDENTLLDSPLLAPPPAMSKQTKSSNDCAGREPCADCTCGRKDSTNAQQQVASSSCGKCGLGDAFRCASCPYLGKPAFKAGEEHLVLELQDDF